MLVLFRYKNFGPFKEEATLDMRAIKAYKEHPDNLITKYEDMPLLKVAAIYGSNASGKTSFIDAYYYFSEIVSKSFQKNNKDEEDSFLADWYLPFLLDSACVNGETEFEAVYRYGDYEYQYGFVYTEENVKYEWLYRTSLKTNRLSTILERTPNGIELGATVRRGCEKYVSDIDEDVLALSFFSSLKLKTAVFANVVSMVNSFLPVSLSIEGQAQAMMIRYFVKDFSEEEKPRLLAFLNAIDICIKDIAVEKNGNKVSVYTYHLGKNGELCRFPIEIESDGTRRAIAVYSFVRLAVLNDRGLLIDEFHSQLHPLLQKYILDLFYEQSDGGQIIYTTHDTTLLDKKYMRRDQIWFTNKNEDGESSLYSLADFNVRNFDSFEKDYLSGIYGGIPNLKDYSFVGGISDGEG